MLLQHTAGVAVLSRAGLARSIRRARCQLALPPVARTVSSTLARGRSCLCACTIFSSAVRLLRAVSWEHHPAPRLVPVLQPQQLRCSRDPCHVDVICTHTDPLSAKFAAYVLLACTLLPPVVYVAEVPRSCLSARLHASAVSQRVCAHAHEHRRNRYFPRWHRSAVGIKFHTRPVSACLEGMPGTHGLQHLSIRCWCTWVL